MWNRILVTGNAGSGKSTVASRLGELLGREVTGLDSIVWGPGWSRPPADERDAAIDAIAEAPSWLVGGVSIVLCEAADVIVFLDMPRSTCYLGYSGGTCRICFVHDRDCRRIVRRLRLSERW